ncbi:MAG: ABC transporter permease [Anaeroplasma sp.]
MKLSHAWYLAKLNNENNKKQNKNIFISFSFSMFLIMCVLFFIISLYFGIFGQVNSNSLINTIYCNYSDSDKDSFIDNKYYDEINSISGIEESICYSVYTIPFDGVAYKNSESIDGLDIQAKEDFFIDGEKLSVTNSCKKMEFSFFDLNESYHTILNSEKKYFKKRYGINPILRGTDEIRNKNEIVLSSSFIANYNLNIDEIVGKKLTFKTTLLGGTFIDSNSKLIKSTIESPYYLDKDVTIFENYVIVGVYDYRIDNLSFREGIAPGDYINIFFSSEALNLISQSVVKKSISFYKYLIDPIDLSNECISSGEVYLPLGINFILKTIERELLQFGNYNDSKNAMAILNDIVKKSNANSASVTPEETLSKILDYDKYLNYIMTFLSIFGIAILASSIINIYNTIQYSINKNKRYIGMLRAMGMYDVDTYKIYGLEIFIIWIKSFMLSTICSLMVCLVLMLIFNNVIFIGDLYGVIRISFAYYPVSIFIVMVFTALLLMIISFALCKSIINKSNIELLNE